MTTKPSSERPTSVLPDDGILNGCFVEIYDDAIVLTGKSLSLVISNCHFIRCKGKDAPDLAPGQFAISTSTIEPFFA